MERKIIGQFDRNAGESVVVAQGTYREKEYVDIRIFYHDAVSGDFKPTKKGLTLSVQLVPSLLELLQKVNQGGIQ